MTVPVIMPPSSARLLQCSTIGNPHVLRHLNKDADRLANEAMDKGMGRARTDRADAYAKPPAELKEVRGFVRNGAVEFVDEKLPDGIFVTVRPARKS